MTQNRRSPIWIVIAAAVLVNGYSIADRYLWHPHEPVAGVTDHAGEPIRYAEVTNIDNVFVGEPCYFKIPITNLSPVPVAIELTETSCGCTTAVMAKQKIEAGETSHLTGKIRSPKRPEKVVVNGLSCLLLTRHEKSRSIGESMRKTQHYLSALIFIPIAVSSAFGSDAALSKIRSQAFQAVASISSVTYAYHVEHSDGWESRGVFHGMGTKFRIDRMDSAGPELNGMRQPPFTSAVTFDGEFHQERMDGRELLFKRSGNVGASYPMLTPQTLLYLWLTADVPFRWDTAQDSLQWEKRFHHAEYIGATTVNGIAVEQVLFPSPVPGEKLISETVVSFAEKFRHLPVKWVRRIKATGEAATVVAVSEFTEVDVDGDQFPFPLKLTKDRRKN